MFIHLYFFSISKEFTILLNFHILLIINIYYYKYTKVYIFVSISCIYELDKNTKRTREHIFIK